MFPPPAEKSSAAIRAASTEPMPLVSWKIPEMSLSTPTRTTSPEISARDRPGAANDSATAVQMVVAFMDSSPSISFPGRLWQELRVALRPGHGSRRRHLHRQAFEAAQRVVIAALHLAGNLDRSDLARECSEHHLAFEARDQLSDAHVNP